MIVTNDLNSTSSTLLRDCEENVETKSNVNHPDHYHQGSVECIEAIDDCGYGLDFCVGNAMKYLWRYKLKGKPLEDLKKAQWYIDHAIAGISKGDYTL